MTKKERFQKIAAYFESAMPMPETELHYSNNYELLVAVMLSAQCTDKRVNQITPALFKAFPTPKDLACANENEIIKYISSVSYPNSKARHLAEMAKMLIKDFSGIVPENGEELERLPGVGRKTANVIASVIYDKPVIAVDTHVFRVSRRIGLSDGATVEAVEKDLTAGFPEQLRGTAHHWLILHGRYVCTARRPKCSSCGLQDLCRDFRLNNLCL